MTKENKVVFNIMDIYGPKKVEVLEVDNNGNHTLIECNALSLREGEKLLEEKDEYKRKRAVIDHFIDTAVYKDTGKKVFSSGDRDIVQASRYEVLENIYNIICSYSFGNSYIELGSKLDYAHSLNNYLKIINKELNIEDFLASIEVAMKDILKEGDLSKLDSQIGQILELSIKDIEVAGKELVEAIEKK